MTVSSSCGGRVASKVTQNLSSPSGPQKSLNYFKTNRIKAKNNWRTSFGQFGKIEVTGKQDKSPATKPGLRI
jgi:hypothetical protein